MSSLKDIALKVGVSKITVSRVLNTPEKVGKETKEAVYAAMKELNYLPNQAAKALASNKVGVVKVLIPNTIELSHPFSMNFIAGISDSLSKDYYSFSLIRDPKINQRCDGIIVLGMNNDEELDTIRNLDIPVVMLGRRDDEIDWVEVDNFYGAYIMTEHLISNGHRNIAMINISEKKNFCFDRLNGYMQALKDNNIPVSSNLIKYAQNIEGDGYKATTELLSTENVSAIFCSSDILALGAIRAAKFLNRNVPHDISIGGFDGLGIHLLTDPKITSVKQPVFLIGQRMAEILLNKINDKFTPHANEIIKPELVVEQSTTRNYSSI